MGADFPASEIHFDPRRHAARVEFADNTAQRIKAKAQAGLETQIEILIADCGDPSIPLSQRTEAYRVLARLGDLDGQGKGNVAGEKFIIQLNIGPVETKVEVKDMPKVIEHQP